MTALGCRPVTTVLRHHPRPPAAPPRPAWLSRLSPREEEVLHCLARGMSNPEVAEELFISVSTVKTHVARLLDKVAARDRVQLVVAAYTSGFMRT